jgi:hypothetical protein
MFEPMFEPKMRGQRDDEENAAKKNKKRSLDRTHWKKNVDMRKLWKSWRRAGGHETVGSARDQARAQ